MNFQFLFMTSALFPSLDGLGPFIMEVLIGIVFGYVLYFLFLGIGLIITFAQSLFNKAAGLDSITLTQNHVDTPYGGAGNEDLVIGLLRNESVNKAFFAILGVCLVLLLIFTIIAVIKTEFSLKYTSKAPIISRALSSLANFFVIPIIFLVGIVATTSLVWVVNGVFTTSNNDREKSLTYKCFQVAASNANRARNNESFADYLSSGQWIGGSIEGHAGGGSGGGGGGVWGSPANVGDYYESSLSLVLGADFQSINPFANKSPNEVADLIDEIFKNPGGKPAEAFSKIIITQHTYKERSLMEGESGHQFIDWHTSLMGYPDLSEHISIFNIKTVNYFYEFINFNYIIGLGAGIIVAWNMLGVCLLLFKRLFEMMILFLLSPIMTAVAPLDNGNAEKNLRGQFIKRLFSVIGPVFAYNLFFIILSIFGEFSPFGFKEGEVLFGQFMSAVFLNAFNIMFQILAIIVGLGLLKSANSMFTSMLGMDDLFSQSDATMKKAIGTTQKVALGTTAGLGLAVRGTAQTIKGVKTAGSFIKDKVHDSKLDKFARNEGSLESEKAATMEGISSLQAEQDKFREEGEYFDAWQTGRKVNRKINKMSKLLKTEKDLEKYKESDKYKYKQSKATLKDLKTTASAPEDEPFIEQAIKEEESNISAYKSDRSQARKDKRASGFMGRTVTGFKEQVKSMVIPSGANASERLKESFTALTGEGVQKARSIIFDKDDRKAFYKSKEEIQGEKAKGDKESKDFSEGKGAELNMLKKVTAREKGKEINDEYDRLQKALANAISDGVLSEQKAAKRNLDSFDAKHGITKDAQIMQASINNLNSPKHDKDMELLNSYLENSRKQAKSEADEEARKQKEALAEANKQALSEVMDKSTASTLGAMKEQTEAMNRQTELLAALARGFSSIENFVKSSKKSSTDEEEQKP